MSGPSRTDRIDIRPGSGDDVPAVIELMRSALGESRLAKTEQFFAWKHRDNPFGASPMLLAHDGQKLVGARLFLRWQWQSNARAVRAVRAVDTSTHPDYQGRGIFKQLTLQLVQQMQAEGAGFVFNTPNQKSRPGYLKMGWVAAGRLPLWIRPCRPTALARASTMAETQAQELQGSSDVSSMLRAFADAEASGLLDTTRRAYHTPWTAARLEWRYARCPAARYAALTAASGRALLVYRVRSRLGLRELTICELCYEPSLSGARAAAEALERAVRLERPDYAAAALRAHAWDALAMTRARFLPAPRLGPILTIRQLTPEPALPDPRKLTSWAGSIGDMELF